MVGDNRPYPTPFNQQLTIGDTMELSTIAKRHDAINLNQPRFKLESYIPDVEMTFLAMNAGMVLAHNYNQSLAEKAAKAVNSFGWCN